MIGLRMCSRFISVVAWTTKHHPVGEFLNSRMKYKFMQMTRIGLHVSGFVVSSEDNPNPFFFIELCNCAISFYDTHVARAERI